MTTMLDTAEDRLAELMRDGEVRVDGSRLTDEDRDRCIAALRFISARMRANSFRYDPLG